jgi:hypothetical protein
MSESVELSELKLMVENLNKRIERMEHAFCYSINNLFTSISESPSYDIFKLKTEILGRFHRDVLFVYTTKFDDERLTDEEYDEALDKFENEVSEQDALIRQVLSNREQRRSDTIEKTVSDVKKIHKSNGGKKIKTRKNKRRN